MNQKPLREAGEDYLEAILNLEDADGEVRSVDVARELAVSRPSVNKAIGVLKDMGMVEQEPYSAIRLTSKGRKKAEEVAHRHELLEKFLIDVLGVSPKVADEDACKMEHVISKETKQRITEYLDRYQHNE